MPTDSIQKQEGFRFISHVALGLFLLCSVADVLLLVFHMHSEASLLKAVLMPLLLFYVLSQIFRHGGEKSAAFCATGALVLHCLGDIILELRGEGVFVVGLAAFLVGHICYLTYIIRKLGKLRFPENAVWVLSGLIAIGLALALTSGEGKMIIPVAVYSLALMSYVATGVAGLLKSDRTKKSGMGLLRGAKSAYCFILYGGILFIISDALIALGAFRGLTFPYKGAVVMGTYLLAEFLLASGVWKMSLFGNTTEK